ncbi:hypothetical protein E4U58_003588 [Claviceps cyperi]|nr:hypothetical protein E4U58_003588 [Claviceps cyperi]
MTKLCLLGTPRQRTRAHPEETFAHGWVMCIETASTNKRAAPSTTTLPRTTLPRTTSHYLVLPCTISCYLALYYPSGSLDAVPSCHHTPSNYVAPHACQAHASFPVDRELVRGDATLLANAPRARVCRGLGQTRPMLGRAVRQ